MPNLIWLHSREFPISLNLSLRQNWELKRQRNEQGFNVDSQVVDSHVK
jgi:hypothetical protein